MHQKCFTHCCHNNQKYAFKKSARPDRKYFHNETLGYDQFGYRKQFVPDTGLKASQKCFQLSFQ